MRAPIPSQYISSSVNNSTRRETHLMPQFIIPLVFSVSLYLVLFLAHLDDKVVILISDILPVITT